jgi:hypothetical protein
VIIIGSHNESELKNLSNLKNLKACLFSDLRIDFLSNPDQFAEAQIFFDSKDLMNSGKYAGLVSPRFHERYPHWPALAEIDEHLEVNEKSIKANQVLAPQAFSCKVKNLKYWIALQELAHPGMGNILNELREQMQDRDQNDKGNLIMGNTFIMTSVYSSFFLKNWQSLVSKLDLNDKNSFNYSYRCLKCGSTSEEGMGRWRANRQPAYLMERITALAGFNLENLEICKFDRDLVVKRRLFPINIFTYLLMLLGFRLSSYFYKFSKKSCDHLHFQPGKLG